MFFIFVYTSECFCFQLLCILRCSFIRGLNEHGDFILGGSFFFVCCAGTKQVVHNLWICRQHPGLSRWQHSGLTVLFSGDTRIENCGCQPLHEETEMPNCCLFVYTIDVTRKLQVAREPKNLNTTKGVIYVWLHLSSHVFRHFTDLFRNNVIQFDGSVVYYRSTVVLCDAKTSVHCLNHFQSSCLATFWL